MNSRLMMTSAIQRRQHVEVDEREQRRGHEELVGERVEELAEGRDLVARAREVAVDAVGGREHAEDRGRDPRLSGAPASGRVDPARASRRAGRRGRPG